MHFALNVLLLLAFCLQESVTKDIPDNLAAFLTKVRNEGPCKTSLPGDFYDIEGGSKSFHYCNDYASQGIIYLKGPGDKLANMDVDCDGHRNQDSLCSGHGDTQGRTTFKDQVQAFGIPDLDASVHNYVVFGNDNDPPKKAGYTTFNPQDYGIHPLSLMAVVCEGHLYYGIWGDTNGNDGPPLVGEASISLARLCFGDKMTESNGHDGADVLYIAFKGKDAVPGRSGAAWKAASPKDFQSNPDFNRLGDELVSKIKV